MLDFQTNPAAYRHWQLSVDGRVATLAMDVDEAGGLRDDYELKLNSYDLGVDIVNMYDAGLRDRIASLTGYRPYRLTSRTLLSVPGVGLSDENQTRLLGAMRDSPPPVADLRRMHGALDDQGGIVTGLVMALQSLLELLGTGAGSV